MKRKKPTQQANKP